MQLYYSPSSGGFYRDDVHRDIPADAMPIPADTHAALLAAQAQGKIIQAGSDGQPVAMDQPGPTAQELREMLLNQIGQRKNEKRDGGFVVRVDGVDVRWDSDVAARLAYAELVQRMASEPEFTTRWKASEGQWVNMDAALFQIVYATGAQHVAAAFAWQEAEEARLSATPDDELATFVVAG